MSTRITRRDFLKLSGAGLMSALISGVHADSSQAQGLIEGQQGRIITNTVKAYAEPTDQSKFITSYYKDQVIPISETALGVDETARNRIWYKLGNGYAHSAKIQPVRTQLNMPEQNIRPFGMLAEVTVPYTDAHEEPSLDSDVVYRLYYETTYWIDRLIWDAQGNAWYRLFDDKRKKDYYAPATHLRIVPDGEFAPISPTVEPARKLLAVNLTDQIVIAYEDRQPVFMTRASTGVTYYKFHTTPVGWYITNHKRLTRHMAAGDPASSEGFDLPGIPWVSYFTKSGISFHGTYWHNDFGTPRSHGCINLTPQAAKWVFRWTVPTVTPGQQFALKDYGTSVNVHE
jgi:lipoprotein-anchoring transpeptidase ErfK/SrfK